MTRSVNVKADFQKKLMCSRFCGKVIQSQKNIFSFSLIKKSSSAQIRASLVLALIHPVIFKKQRDIYNGQILARATD